MKKKLEETMEEFAKNLVDNQEDMPTEISSYVNEHIFELV